MTTPEFANRYDVIRRIGGGGMGEVYLAHDNQLDRDVALKFLGEKYVDDRQFVERFKREARSAAGINHPNVVHVYETGEGIFEGRDVPYISMEYVPGNPLKDLIVQREFGIAARADEEGGILGSFSCLYNGLEITTTETGGFSFTGSSEEISMDFKDFNLDEEWHVYRLEVQGNTVRLFFDGAPILEATDNLYLDSGEIGMVSDDAQINVRSFRYTEL